MKPPTGFSNEVPIGGFLYGMYGMSDVFHKVNHRTYRSYRSQASIRCTFPAGFCFGSRAHQMIPAITLHLLSVFSIMYLAIL